MEPLVLTFRDAAGDLQKLQIEVPAFVIGRHSACDLCIPDGRLSREHVRIERNEDGFDVTELGSSNGSKLNDEPLLGTKQLRDGDELELGGAVVFRVGEKADAVDASPTEEEFSSAPEPVAELPSPAAKASGGIPMIVFIAAPVIAIVLLVVVIGGIVLFRGKRPAATKDGNEFVYTTKDDDLDDKPEKPSKSGTPATGDSNTADSPGGGSNTVVATDSPSTPPGGQKDTPSEQSDSAKVERSGASFLRRIAANDTKAFLTADQSTLITTKVKQLSKSSALSDNINSAKKNSAAIASLAKSKNLTPQFLAVAALTKLGSGRGDALQAAQSVADVFDKLATQIGNERADDSLLMVAALDQGAAGDFMKMRNMLQDLSNKFPESTRAIRTIWFLQKNGKITADEFDRAVNFLAIGTITQNPKAFGVNSEPLIL